MDDWGAAPKRLRETATEERIDLILIIIILVLLFGAGSAIAGGDMAAASVSAVFC
jgi:hypothetical protein